MALDDEMEQLRAQIGHDLSVRSGVTNALCSELENIKVQVTQVLTTLACLLTYLLCAVLFMWFL